MMHNTKAERFANEAIFTLQFNRADAIRYIQRNAGVDEKVARQVFTETVTFHKQPKQVCATA
jgi:hypothetical protein